MPRPIPIIWVRGERQIHRRDVDTLGDATVTTSEENAIQPKHGLVGRQFEALIGQISKLGIACDVDVLDSGSIVKNAYHNTRDTTG